MAFKSEGKDMHPITVFAECWSIHSKMVRLGKHAHSREQTEKSHSLTNSAAVSRHVYIHALLVQQLYSVFFSTYGLVLSNIRNSLDAG